MTSNHYQAAIRNLVDLLLRNDAAITGNPVTEMRIGSRTRITWLRSSASVGPACDNDFGSIDEYCVALQQRAYNVMLCDGSLLQLSFDLRGHDLVGHRLCWLPCPYRLEQEELREFDPLDIMLMYENSGRKYLRLRSPLRFDYDPESVRINHPSVHLHVNSDECRCAVVAPISLGHFIRFVFQHFYPLLWGRLEFLREWPRVLETRTITTEEESGLHIACRR